MRAVHTNRRGFLTAAMAFPAAALSLGAESPRGRESVPQDPQDRMEGAPIGDGQRFVPVRGQLFSTPYDNDPFIIGVEGQVRCTCGCLHTVYVCRMVDFNCDFWPRHHATMVEQSPIDAHLSTVCSRSGNAMRAVQVTRQERRTHGDERAR